MVDRSEEYLSLLPSNHDDHSIRTTSSTIPVLTLHHTSNTSNSFVMQALLINSTLTDNELLLKRLSKLVTLKEFSNDPSTQIKDIAAVFQSAVPKAQKQLEKLKLQIAQQTELCSISSHNAQHRQMIVQFSARRLASQLNEFKSALDTHTEHIQRRNKRVSKYGSTVVRTTALSGDNRYAMFSVPHDQYQEAESSSSVRNRRGVPPSSSSSGDPVCDPEEEDKYRKVEDSRRQRSHIQLQQTRHHRSISSHQLKEAQQAEASIMQMGKLFSQMATLVSEQSEIIMRIEDDVEAGLDDTLEAQASLQRVHDITKGNRGLVLKVFLLLVFFILLFLMWT